MMYGYTLEYKLASTILPRIDFVCSRDKSAFTFFLDSRNLDCQVVSFIWTPISKIWFEVLGTGGVGYVASHHCHSACIHHHRGRISAPTKTASVTHLEILLKTKPFILLKVWAQYPNESRLYHPRGWERKRGEWVSILRGQPDTTPERHIRHPPHNPKQGRGRRDGKIWPWIFIFIIILDTSLISLIYLLSKQELALRCLFAELLTWHSPSDFSLIFLSRPFLPTTFFSSRTYLLARTRLPSWRVITTAVGYHLYSSIIFTSDTGASAAAVATTSTPLNLIASLDPPQ